MRREQRRVPDDAEPEGDAVARTSSGSAVTSPVLVGVQAGTTGPQEFDCASSQSAFAAAQRMPAT
jgi:hypothetical protein